MVIIESTFLIAYIIGQKLHGHLGVSAHDLGGGIIISWKKRKVRSFDNIYFFSKQEVMVCVKLNSLSALLAQDV